MRLRKIKVSAAVHMLYVNMSFRQTRTKGSSTDGLLLKHTIAFLITTDQSSTKEEWFFNIYLMF